MILIVLEVNLPPHLKIKLIFYGLNRIMQFSVFVWLLVAIKSDFLSHKTYNPCHFSQTLPLRFPLFREKSHLRNGIN